MSGEFVCVCIFVCVCVHIYIYITFVTGSGQGQVEDAFEWGNEPYGSIKRKEFLHLLRTC
jgi:hypothetical protein